MAEENKTRELNQADLDWIESSIKNGYQVINWYIKSNEVTPANLDKAFNVWKADTSDNRAPEGLVASGLGILFGQYVIEHKKASWVIVVDEQHGENLALVSDHGAEVYPIGEVWLRIDPKNEDKSFFEPIWTTEITLKY